MSLGSILNENSLNLIEINENLLILSIQHVLAKFNLQNKIEIFKYT